MSNPSALVPEMGKKHLQTSHYRDWKCTIKCQKRKDVGGTKKPKFQFQNRLPLSVYLSGVHVCICHTANHHYGPLRLVKRLKGSAPETLPSVPPHYAT